MNLRLRAFEDYGTSVVVGVPGAGKEIVAPAVWLLTGRTWKGALFGSMNSRDDLPKLVERVRDGRIPVDEFITARLPFRQIRKAWDLMLDPAGNSYAIQLPLVPMVKLYFKNNVTSKR